MPGVAQVESREPPPTPWAVVGFAWRGVAEHIGARHRGWHELYWKYHCIDAFAGYIHQYTLDLMQIMYLYTHMCMSTYVDVDNHVLVYIHTHIYIYIYLSMYTLFYS